MSSEITISACRMRVRKASVNIDELFVLPAQTRDMAGDAISQRTQSIAAGGEGVNVPLDAAIGTPGWAVFKNQGPTNYVEIGRQVAGTFYTMDKLLAGEQSLPRRLGCGATEIYARANTAAILLSHKIVEA